MVQRQENPNEEERKDPLSEGLKTTGEQLAEHKPFKDWYEPKLEHLKYTLWDKASVADKAAMLTYLGLKLGTAAASLDPRIRAALSGMNIGKPLGWIPYSPIEGFKYTLPGPGKSAYGFSADSRVGDYLALLRKKYPHLPLTEATFGLESAYDPAGKGLSLTRGEVRPGLLWRRAESRRQDVQGPESLSAPPSGSAARRAGLVADAGSARYAENQQAWPSVRGQRRFTEAVSAIAAAALKERAVS
jgi:hypothetical protein